MTAAKKMPAEVEQGIDALVNKAVAARMAQGTTPGPNEPGGDLVEAAYGVKALPPRHDQAMWDRIDPVHKGAGADVIRWAKYSHIAKTNGMAVEAVALKLGDDRMKAAVLSLDEYRKHVQVQTKALAESTLLDGGALVPPEYSSEFFPLLRNATVVLESGARVMEMSGQALNIGRQNAPGTAAYVGENAVIAASQQQFGMLAFATKKLGALTGFSNDFLRDAGPAAEQKVRDDLVAILGLKFDISALRADGTQGVIKGLRYLTNSANIFAATQAGTDATGAEMAKDLGKAKRLLKAANIPLQGWGWAISPRTEQYLQNYQTSFGISPFAAEMEKGMLRGLPYKVTAAIPENLGGGSNESEIYLCAWPQFLIGQNLALEVMLFPNGAAPDIGGTMVSGIASDLSWLRAISRHDSQLAYDKACVVITTVKWGA